LPGIVDLLAGVPGYRRGGDGNEFQRVRVWEWSGYPSCRHVRALLCISFLRHQKPKQHKTVEKEKISVFSLEWNCCGGSSEIEDGGRGAGRQCSKGQVKTSWIESMDLSAVDGDISVGETLSKTL